MYVFGTSYVIDYLQRYFARFELVSRTLTDDRVPAIDTNANPRFSVLFIMFIQ